MSEVKRHTVHGYGRQDIYYNEPDGEFVFYEDYAELKAQRDALAVENEQLRQINALCGELANDLLTDEDAQNFVALASQQPADDDWIEWDGGECPLSVNSLVNVRYREGGEDLESKPAEVYNWSRNDKDCYPIIAYRVVKP